MRLLRAPAAIAVLTVAACLCSSRSAKAQDYCCPGFVPDLFYNYYVPPVACCDHGALGAQLYVSPLPVPPRVGWTYITYPPLAPQEWLYKHKREYWKPNGPYGATTKAHVWWY